MEHTYEVVNGKFSAEEVEKLHEMVRKYSGHDPKPLFEGTGLLQKDALDSPDYYPNNIDPDRLLVKVIETVREYFLEKYEMLGTFEFNRTFGVTMLEGAHLPAHRDEDPNPEGEFDGKKRSHVCSMILNDDYEGGELLFPDQGGSIKPEAGSMVMFPGYYVAHGVGEITKGTRRVLLVFFYDVLP
jgi:hypothetical protein